MREKMCDPDRISKSGAFSAGYNRTGINLGNMTRVSVPLGRKEYGLRKPSECDSTGGHTAMVTATPYAVHYTS